MERVMRLGALNVVAQPHSQDIYHQIIKHLRRSQRAVRIRGDRFGMIASLNSLDGPASDRFVEGLIVTFTPIDVTADWVNITSGKKAQDDELSTIQIPKNLQPNAKFHHFRFYLKDHTLLFEVGNSGTKLTPENAGRMFERLLSAPDVEKKFGQVISTVLPNSDTIDRIITHKRLRYIHIVLYAPNPDKGAAAEQKVKNRLEKMLARRMERIVVAKSKAHLALDEEIVQEARIGAKNGKVEAKVEVGKKVEKISTVETPFLYSHSYYAGEGTIEGEFGVASGRAVSDLRG